MIMNGLLAIFSWTKENVVWIISLFSLFLAARSLQVNTNQFRILNQGYLDATPGFDLTVPNNDKMVVKPQLNAEDKIEGLNFYLILKNVGRLPIEYHVGKFDVHLDGIKLNSVGLSDKTMGVLYPNKELPFHLMTTHFNLEKNPIAFSQVKCLKIGNDFRIRYFDLGTKRSKFHDRNLEWEIHDNTTTYRYLSFNDKV